MSILLRTIGAGVALPLTVLFSTSASNSAADITSPAATTELSLASTSTLPLLSQEEKIEQAVQKFRSDFAARVQRNDYSGKWNSCFSTKYGEREVEYNPAVVRNLRTSRLDYNRALLLTFPTHDNAPFQRVSVSMYFPEETPAPVEEEVPKDIVVLDYGHGHEARGARAGYDTGTIDPATGLRETSVIDRTGTALKEELERDYNLIVVETRSPVSEGLTLRNSTAKFKNQPTALQVRSELSMYLAENFPDRRVIFVSLHGNSGLSSGSEVYYYAPNRGGRTDSPASLDLARSIAANFRLHAGSRTQTISNDFAVLRCQTNPAVLVELGYLQNSNDRAALARTDRIAAQLGKGISSYLSRSAVPPAPVPNVTIAMNTP